MTFRGTQSRSCAEVFVASGSEKSPRWGIRYSWKALPATGPLRSTTSASRCRERRSLTSRGELRRWPRNGTSGSNPRQPSNGDRLTGSIWASTPSGVQAVGGSPPQAFYPDADVDDGGGALANSEAAKLADSFQGALASAIANMDDTSLFVLRSELSAIRAVVAGGKGKGPPASPGRGPASGRRVHTVAPPGGGGVR